MNEKKNDEEPESSISNPEIQSGILPDNFISDQEIAEFNLSNEDIIQINTRIREKVKKYIEISTTRALELKEQYSLDPDTLRAEARNYLVSIFSL